MNAEQAYINGFVKRANEYGLKDNEAIELLKEANAMFRALARGAVKPATIANRMNIHPERMHRMALHNSPGQGLNARYPEAPKQITLGKSLFDDINKTQNRLSSHPDFTTAKQLTADPDFKDKLRKMIFERKNPGISVTNPSITGPIEESASLKKLPNMSSVATETRGDIQGMRQLNKNNPAINY